ncbi:MAG: hypothetical protein ACK4S4_15320 [Pyrinomonadaceae bacterium]
MSNAEQNQQNQKGAPQDTAQMPSSGNSPSPTGSTEGTDESSRSPEGGDPESKGSSSGAATQTAPESGESTASNVYKNDTGDPGRTPGSAEGVEDFQKTGNE